MRSTRNPVESPAPANARSATHDAEPRASSWRPAVYGWALLALLAGLLLTGFVHYQQQQKSQAEWLAGQRALADQGFSALNTRLHAAELFLRAAQSLFLSSEEVTAAEFADMYANMRPQAQFPSLQAMSYAQRETRPDGARYVIDMIAPRAYESVLGMEIGTQPEDLAALKRSLDTDQSTLSAPFRLLFNGKVLSNDEITMRLPIYSPGPSPATLGERRERARGSIGISFTAGGLIGDAIPKEASQTLHVRISDVTGGGDRLLFDSRPGLAMAAAGFAFRRDLGYGGRTWRVHMQSLGTAPARAPGESALPAGIVASILLALLVFSVANTRQRAIALAWRMSRRFRESEERFRAVSESLPAFVLLAEADGGRITYANQASRTRLGDDLDQRELTALFEKQALRDLLRNPTGKDNSHGETLLLNGRDSRFWASVAISRVRLGDEDKLLMVATDVSEQRELTEQLSHQASHDALTELYNRREFERRLQQVLEAMGDGASIAMLLYIDLDQFKLINDTSGHLAGDQLLVQLAARVRQQLGPEDVLARIGGDEFGVLATGLRDRDDADAIAERVRQCIDDYVFTWEAHSHRISASIGAVLIDQAGLTMKNLLAQADAACYEVKDLGRNDVHFHSEHDSQATRRRGEMRWADRLRRAIGEHRLMLAYQEIRSLHVVASGSRVELLLRYRDDDGQLVTPGEFMPAAEHYGLMPTIDRWVVQTAIAHFDRLHPDGTGLRMAAINLSGASIEDQRHAGQILDLLRRHRVEPSRVCFEITETMAVRNIERMAAFIEPLREAGCKIALDDFGAGMSSFTYLKNLPVDIIKIDGSFVRDLLTDPVSQAMVRAVADIGRQRGLVVVAEWVADDATIEALLQLGVQYGQGFELHKPELAWFQRD